MENVAAIEALQRIRTDLIADLRAAERARMALFKRLSRVDRDLEALGGKGYVKPREVKMRRQTFRRGELKRLVATALRDLGPDVTSRQIAEIALKRVGLDGATNGMVWSLASQVGAIRRGLTLNTDQGASSSPLS